MIQLAQIIPVAVLWPLSLLAGFPQTSAIAIDQRGVRWSEGRVYPLLAAPGQLSSIALEPGEKLISVAAGDTAEWIIGDTSSGSGEQLRRHVLVKPVRGGLKTNLIITTDRRVYRVALESRLTAPISDLRWNYVPSEILAVRLATPTTCNNRFEPTELNFNYRFEGDNPRWRPLRAFDNGAQTFIEFPPAFGHGEAPPLFLKGAKGRPELVNYRVKGRYYVVDRIFSVAELRLGSEKQQKVVITRAANADKPRKGTGS